MMTNEQKAKDLPYIKLKALDLITVDEFNTLLEIVKLNKFKIK